MNQAQLVKLLGRPLTPTESSNFGLYLEIATETVEGLICTTISPSATAEARVFDTRESYRTAFIGIYRSITEVKINDTVIDTSKYSERQWDKRNATWYNSIVLDHKFTRCESEIEVTALWGFAADAIPVDLQLLIARAFDMITKQNNLDRTINSKKVEDFSISFNHSSITLSDTVLESFAKDNALTISKYSLCDILNVQHGEVCNVYSL